MPPSNAPFPPVLPGVVSKVFLSSTIEDLRIQRDRVLDAARSRAETFCWLSEQARSEPTYATVEDYCRRKLLEANGYILLLGHWYGWVPPDEPRGRSITHLEFEWAFERWHAEAAHCMAVMMPAVGCKLDLALQRQAESIIGERKVDPDRHARSIEDFHAQVCGGNGKRRIVTRFKTARDLCDSVVSACLSFRDGLLLHVAAAATPAHASVPQASAGRSIGDAELGALGRSEQCNAALLAVSGALRNGTHPALGLLVHGDAQAGQRVFLSHLWTQLPTGLKPLNRGGQLPSPLLDDAALCNWVWRSLGFEGAGATTPQAVADACHAELAKRSLAFQIDRVGRLQGGLSAFHARFWRPFCEHLGELSHARLCPHRLLAIFADYVSEPAAWATLLRDTTKGATQPVDGSLLWPLPCLEPITAGELDLWLDTVHAHDDPVQREPLKLRLLTGDGGASDPVPLNVLERLRGELEAGTIPFKERRP